LLLDTNVLSETARPAPNPGVLEFIEAQGETFISAITVYELERGVERLPAGKRRRSLEAWLALTLAGPHGVLAFDDATARGAARLEARLRREGRAIETRDLFIAATALTHNLTLVTHNVGDFAGTGAMVIDPFARPG
jgi:predicted nucleic acid-binding protein